MRRKVTAIRLSERERQLAETLSGRDRGAMGKLFRRLLSEEAARRGLPVCESSTRRQKGKVA